MSWFIDYNGFGSTEGGWSNLSIDEYRVDPIMDAADQAVSVHRHVVRGTALIPGGGTSTATGLISSVRAARDALVDTVRSLEVKVTGGTGASRTLIDFDSTTETAQTEGYPRGNFSITEVFGELSAMVAFEIAWETIPFPGTPASEAISHVWRQRFDIAETGESTWSVEGELRVRADGAEPNADAYRDIVTPTVPAGFRLDSADYAVNEAGDLLVYSIQFNEFGRRLPAPASSGTGSFTYRRSLESSLLGRKQFDLTLIGAPGTDRGELLAAALKVSLNRINYVDDRILEFEVEESLLDQNEIGVRIVAESMGGPEVTDMGGVASLTTEVVGELDGLAESSQPNPYGASLIRAVRRGIFRPGDALDAAEANPDGVGTETVYTIADNSDATQFDGVIPGGLQSEVVTAEAKSNPYTAVDSTITVRTQPQIVKLTTASANPVQIPYEVDSPTVTVMQELRVERLNKTPDIVLLGPIEGSIVQDERISTSAGPLDANGNRTLGLTVRRDVELLDGMASGFYSQTVDLGGGNVVTVRAWSPPNDRVRMPYDPKTETASAAGAANPFSTGPGGLSDLAFDIALPQRSMH